MAFVFRIACALAAHSKAGEKRSLSWIELSIRGFRAPGGDWGSQLHSAVGVEDDRVLYVELLRMAVAKSAQWLSRQYAAGGRLCLCRIGRSYQQRIPASQFCKFHQFKFNTLFAL